MVTTNEVLKETGLTYPMLNRLKDLRIIPKPKLKGQGRHKGVIGEFKDDVIDTIKWVKKQQNAGQSLVQIAENLREMKVEVGNITAYKPDTSFINWAARLLVELHIRYPDDDFISAEIEGPFEEKPDGSVTAQFRIRKIPRQ